MKKKLNHIFKCKIVPLYSILCKVSFKNLNKYFLYEESCL